MKTILVPIFYLFSNVNSHFEDIDWDIRLKQCVTSHTIDLFFTKHFIKFWAQNLAPPLTKSWIRTWKLIHVMKQQVLRGCTRFLNLWQFLAKLKETGSLGATESEVWIANFNVKAWKTTEHKLHKIWCSLKFWAKRAQPMGAPGTHGQILLFWCSFH